MKMEKPLVPISEVMMSRVLRVLALVSTLSVVVMLHASSGFAREGLKLAPTVAAQAAMPPAKRTVFWQQVCEDAAKGELSPQPALVCTHSGFPIWAPHVVALLGHICEDALGGTFVYRSQFPLELAACFLD